MSDARFIGFLLKVFASMVLIAVAVAKTGPTFDGWLITSLAGFSGMFWQSAGDDLFRRHPNERR